MISVGSVIRGNSSRRLSASCSAAQMYCPLCELTPWQITITARGLDAGRHDRKKISMPFVSLNRSSCAVANVVIKALLQELHLTNRGPRCKGHVFESVK